MQISLEWLRAEAERQGLMLTEEDLVAIRAQLDATKAALAARPAGGYPRPDHAYRFVPPGGQP